MIINRLFSLIVFFLFALNSFAQSIQMDVIGSAGENNSTSTHSISWTIGEIVIETVTSNNIILTQGFHQPNYLITSIEDNASEYKVSLYPNPAENDIILFQEEVASKNLNYQIFDLNGKSLIQGNVINKITKIDISEFSRGVYILNLIDIDQNQILKSFKIEKI